jgi:hypothetical protein
MLFLQVTEFYHFWRDGSWWFGEAFTEVLVAMAVGGVGEEC